MTIFFFSVAPRLKANIRKQTTKNFHFYTSWKCFKICFGRCCEMGLTRSSFALLAPYRTRIFHSALTWSGSLRPIGLYYLCLASGFAMRQNFILYWEILLLMVPIYIASLNSEKWNALLVKNTLCKMANLCTVKIVT